jgi:release factor glutamine methyltransferase
MTLSIATALAEARQRIPPAEVRLFLGRVLGQSAAWLEAHRDEALSPELAGQFSALVARRAAGEPVAYLLGTREFYGREFDVTPDVLIPRPETELLVDIVKDWVQGRGPEKVGAGGTANGSAIARATERPRLLDLGTGSGCIAITLALELPAIEVTAVDVSPQALAVAQRNAVRLGAQVQFVESDWFAALPPAGFDFIVANPPYIAAGDPHLIQGDLRFEPVGALTDQDDGLSAIRRIVTGAPAWLKPGGWLFFEHGYDQAEAVRALLAVAGYAEIQQYRDLADIVRVSGGRCLPAHAASSGLTGISLECLLPSR